MEIRVNEYELPKPIEFNFEELKAELTEKISKYETLVYSDEQIKEAKADRAKLSKLKKALNDERIRREKEYLEPFNVFKAKVNEIISIIDKPMLMIDRQVKEFEEKEKADKRMEIAALWNSLPDKPEWMQLKSIFDEKWLNKSEKMSAIQKSMEERLEKVKSDLNTLAEMPDFGFEAIDEYKRTLDINRAIAEGQRILAIQRRKEELQRQKEQELARLKAEEEAKQAEQKTAADFMAPPEEPEPKEVAKWINFSALLTVSQAKELATFFKARNILFKAI